MAHSVSIDRLRAEFLEMPNLRLARAQTQRLCGIEGHDILCVTPDGGDAHARLTDGARTIEEALMRAKRWLPGDDAGESRDSASVAASARAPLERRGPRQ